MTNTEQEIIGKKKPRLLADSAEVRDKTTSQKMRSMKLTQRLMGFNKKWILGSERRGNKNAKLRKLHIECFNIETLV